VEKFAGLKDAEVDRLLLVCYTKGRKDRLIRKV